MVEMGLETLEVLGSSIACPDSVDSRCTPMYLKGPDPKTGLKTAATRRAEQLWHMQVTMSSVQQIDRMIPQEDASIVGERRRGEGGLDSGVRSSRNL